MGQLHASHFKDNENLLDFVIDPTNPENLLILDHERAFRLVDRASYVLIDKDQALCDCPYKNGHVHLSAPSIYLAVLKNLDLSPGQTFLNIGSGTGYFSTIVGLILGNSPANHGFELSRKCFQHSLNCLDSFLFSDAIYERDFAKPIFFNENIFNVVPVEVPTEALIENSDSDSEDMQHNFITDGIYKWFPNQMSDDKEGHNFDVTLDLTSQYTCPSNLLPYDRIYVGGEVSSKHQFRALLKLLSPEDGVMVAPLRNSLYQIRRVALDKLKFSRIIAVSFAPLVPVEHSSESVSLLDTDFYNRIAHRWKVDTLETLCFKKLLRLARAYILFEKGGLPKLGRHIKIISAVDQQSDPLDVSEEMKNDPMAGDMDCAEPDRDDEENNSPDAELDEVATDDVKWEFLAQEYFFRTEFDSFLSQKAGLHPLITKHFTAQKLYD